MIYGTQSGGANNCVSVNWRLSRTANLAQNKLEEICAALQSLYPSLAAELRVELEHRQRR